MKRHEALLQETLTVHINIAADVGAAKSIGNLTGNRLRKEGVVHNNLIRVPGDLLDYASSFGPPDERIRGEREGKTGNRKMNRH